jgi:hypothetical protein
MSETGRQPSPVKVTRLGVDVLQSNDRATVFGAELDPAGAAGTAWWRDEMLQHGIRFADSQWLTTVWVSIVAPRGDLAETAREFLRAVDLTNRSYLETPEAWREAEEGSLAHLRARSKARVGRSNIPVGRRDPKVISDIERRQLQELYEREQTILNNIMSDYLSAD